MKNLGLKSSEWLAAVGIHTLDDVARLGAVEGYPQKVTLNLLLGLKAALLDLPWNELPPDIREALRKQLAEA